MLAMIELQEIDGNWVFSERVTSLLGVNGEDIKAIDDKKVTNIDNGETLTMVKRLNIYASFFVLLDFTLAVKAAPHECLIRLVDLSYR